MIAATRTPDGADLTSPAEFSTLVVARFAPGEVRSAAAQMIEDRDEARLRAQFGRVLRTIDGEIPHREGTPARRDGARVLVEFSSPSHGAGLDAGIPARASVSVIYRMREIGDSARIYALAVALFPEPEAA